MWGQFENAPNVKTKKLEGLNKEIGVSMVLKEAVITVSYFIWATNFQVLLCVLLVLSMFPQWLTLQIQCNKFCT